MPDAEGWWCSKFAFGRLSSRGIRAGAGLLYAGKGETDIANSSRVQNCPRPRALMRKIDFPERFGPFRGECGIFQVSQQGCFVVQNPQHSPQTSPQTTIPGRQRARLNPGWRYGPTFWGQLSAPSNTGIAPL